MSTFDKSWNLSLYFELKCPFTKKLRMSALCIVLCNSRFVMFRRLFYKQEQGGCVIFHVFALFHKHCLVCTVHFNLSYFSHFLLFAFCKLPAFFRQRYLLSIKSVSEHYNEERRQAGWKNVGLFGSTRGAGWQIKTFSVVCNWSLFFSFVVCVKCGHFSFVGTTEWDEVIPEVNAISLGHTQTLVWW